MADEVFPNKPSDTPASDPTSAPDPYVSPENQRIELLSYEVHRLRTRLGWLSGLSFAVLILASILAGLTLSVKLQQDQQAQRVGALAGDKAGEVDQINSLNQQIAALNQQVTSLSQQVPQDLANQQKATQAQIKQIQAQIQAINSKAVTSDELNKAIQGVQSESNSGGQPTAPSSPAF